MQKLAYDQQVAVIIVVLVVVLSLLLSLRQVAQCLPRAIPHLKTATAETNWQSHKRKDGKPLCVYVHCVCVCLCEGLKCNVQQQQ